MLRLVASGGCGAARSQFASSSGIGRHHTRVESNPTDMRPALLLYWAIGAHVHIHTNTNALYGVRPMSIRGLGRWHTLPTPRHYGRRALCRVLDALPSVETRALGKEGHSANVLFVECRNWHSAKEPLCRVPGQTLGEDSTFAEC